MRTGTGSQGPTPTPMALREDKEPAVSGEAWQRSGAWEWGARAVGGSASAGAGLQQRG